MDKVTNGREWKNYLRDQADGLVRAFGPGAMVGFEQGMSDEATPPFWALFSNAGMWRGEPHDHWVIVRSLSVDRDGTVTTEDSLGWNEDNEALDLMLTEAKRLSGAVAA